MIRTLTRLTATLAAALTLSATAHAEQRCYISLTDSSSEGVRVTTTPDGSLWGRHFGSIHNAPAAYYAAFTVWLIDGEAQAGGTVRFETITEVDGDTQFGNEGWIITNEAARSESFDQSYTPSDCDGLEERVYSAWEG